VRRPIAAVIVALLAGCDGGSSGTPSAAAAPTIPSTTAPGTPTITPTVEPSTSPEPELGAMPASFEPDVEPSEVPPEALVPVGSSVHGQWFAFTDDGVRIVVAWVEAGIELDRQPRGLAIWRRAETSPHWRAVFVRRRPARAGVTDIRTTTADVTGDRSDDVLISEATGGSGACGIWIVVELLAMRSIFRKQLCDGRIEPARANEPGLVMTESVYRPGDAHCCPSAIRRTTLVWAGPTWRVSGRSVTPT
jgi:hypothetical protein